MRAFVMRVLDQQDFLEIQAGFAPNIIVGFGRIQGRTVGVIANQPCVLAGALDINASDKVARFIRFCNAFNIPLVTFVDVPGFLPGVEQEYGGIIRHGAKMLFAYSAATVPKITVVLRKAYGGAYLACAAKTWALIALSPGRRPKSPSWARKARRKSCFGMKSTQPKIRCRARREELIEIYRKTFATPYVSAGRRLVDDVIEPSETRRYLAMALEALQTQTRTSPSQEARADSPVRHSGANEMDLKSKSSHEVTSETLSVIAAAVTEFLGKKVRIRSARVLMTPNAVGRWARQGRTMVQTSHNLPHRER